MNDVSTEPTILIVEDDSAQRLLLAEALDIAGFSHIEASNGQEALDVLDRLIPDAILMDVMMPIMNGFEACRRIGSRKAWADIPVVMMTGSNDVQAIHTAYESGATDFITKPIHYEMLEYRIRYMLRGAGINRALRSSEARMSNTQRIAQLGHWEWNPVTGFISWSAEALRILQIDSTATLEDFFIRIPAAEKTEVEDWFSDAFGGLTDSSIHHHYLCKDEERYLRQFSEPVKDEEGNLLYVYGSLIDITDIRRANDKIHQLAYFDGLTGLPNREQFRDKLSTAIVQARRRKGRLATLFMDLDHFKRVNDTLGHAVGDLLLREVADRVRATLRTSDSIQRLDRPADQENVQVARLGGDEFTILLSEIDNAEAAAIVANRVMETITKPYNLNGNDVFITASIGISVYPEDGEDIEALLKQADVAMYSAKADGRNLYRFFQQEMNIAIQRRMLIENELRKAIRQDELSVHYQLQADLSRNSYCGAEALVRWHNDELGGEISPDEFVPIAEESDLIITMGKWVLAQACRDLVALRDAGINLPQMSVNVSVAQFENSAFVTDVESVLTKLDLPGSSLEIEITESLMLANFDQVMVSIAKLQLLGVKFSLDDFGTGYSSLSYLRKLNLDRLKIDKSFLQDLSISAENSTITKAVIALGGGLDLRVIAEGVENLAQLELLRAWDCDEAQGYFLAVPQSLEGTIHQVKTQPTPFPIPSRSPITKKP